MKPDPPPGAVPGDPRSGGDLTRLRAQATTLGWWVLLGTTVGLAAGVASAGFLLALDAATDYRTRHEAIVWALPLAGLVLGGVYHRWGSTIRAGNNLVIDTLHQDSDQIPLRMAPMVLLGTVFTHLFGGSAGREGTAVQMAASLADAIIHRVGAPGALRRQVLAAGIAAGFGSVFGTPVAGAVFGMEVVCVGRMEYDALLPALIASVVGDLTTRALGVSHTVYPVVATVRLTVGLTARWVLFGLAVGAVATVFVELTHGLRRWLERTIPYVPLRTMAGGAVVVALWRLVGTSTYLGLGVPTILRAFRDPRMPWWTFAAKLVFTSVTLASGFVGGEVTPLFFIGATLGNTLGRGLGIPLDVAAGVGLAALFGAAANTPLALAVMAVEILGAGVFPHVVIVALVAYLASGHRGIYPAQRIAGTKWGGARNGRAVPLRDIDRTTPDE